MTTEWRGENRKGEHLGLPKRGREGSTEKVTFQQCLGRGGKWGEERAFPVKRKCIPRHRGKSGHLTKQKYRNTPTRGVISPLSFQLPVFSS